MVKNQSLARRVKEARLLARAEAIGKQEATYKAHAKKPIEESLKEHIGHFLDKPETWEKGMEAVMLAALAGLSYEAGRSIKHIDEQWVWDTPLKEGETRSTADHIGMHLVPAHDEVTHHAQDLIIGPLGYMLAVKSNGLPAQIAGMAILAGLGIASSGYLGYEPPKGSLIDVCNQIAKGLNSLLGLGT